MGDGTGFHGRLPERGGTEVAVWAVGRLNTMRSLGLSVPIVASFALATSSLAVVITRRFDLVALCLIVIIGGEFRVIGDRLVIVGIVAAMPMGATIGPLVVAALVFFVGPAVGVVLVLRVLTLGVLRVVRSVLRLLFVLIVLIVLAGRVVRADLVVITLVRVVTVPGLATWIFPPER